MEYVAPERRTVVGNVPLAVFLTLGAVTLPWLAFAIGDWRWFSVASSAPLVVAIFAIWIVPESARWMVLRGDVDRTVATLRRCADVNRKIVSDDTYAQFKASMQHFFLN